MAKCILLEEIVTTCFVSTFQYFTLKQVSCVFYSPAIQISPSDPCIIEQMSVINKFRPKLWWKSRHSVQTSRLVIFWATHRKNGKLLDPSILELYRRQFTRTIIVKQKKTPNFQFENWRLYIATVHQKAYSRVSEFRRGYIYIHVVSAVHITVNQNVSVCVEF